MREQMAEAKRRTDLDAKRIMRIQQKAEKIQSNELKHIADYKAKCRAKEDSKTNAGNERRLILQTKKEEKARAEERQKEEGTRLKAVRARHVLAHEEKQLDWLQAH